LLRKGAMKKPLVSVLICTYNAEKTIHWALQSVLDQTYDNLEVLILDNNSKDDTINLLDEYKEKDNRIKVFALEKNLWAYGWLNYLLDKAKWDYIAIQDHDDVWHPTKIEKQIDFLEKNKDYIWSGSSYLEYYSWDKLWFVCDKDWWNSYRVNHTSLVFRNIWVKYDDKNDYLCDIYFMRKILCKDKKLLYIYPEVLSLHYFKKWGENYSNAWFKWSFSEIKKHFIVYGFWIYHILLFFYVYVKRLLPKKIQLWMSKILIRKVKWATDIKNLENDKNIYDMVKYINNKESNL